MSNSFDVLVIGAGNAGQAAAGELVKAGLSVGIVESDDVGGTCPNHGCVPKKILVAASETLDIIRRAHVHGIEVSPATLDWPALISRKNDLIGGMPAGMAKSLAKRGIELFRGSARFVDRNTIEVAGQTLTAPTFVVATGSTPRTLGFDGAELLTTSREFLALGQAPKSAVFVGGGVIAMEFAHVLARTGASVTILEVSGQVLGRADADAVAALTQFSTEVLGIRIETGVEIDSITEVGDEVVVRFRHNGEPREVTAERAIHGAGRVPRIDGLELENAGVNFEKGRLALDGLRSVGNPNIWFAGDILPTAQLSPVASAEGKVVGRLISGQDATLPRTDSLPSAVYTTPVLASVGLTEKQARASGRDVEVKSTDITGWLAAKTYAEDAAYAKVLVDRATDTIVGAHLVGHGASETINFLSLAIDHGVTATEIRSRQYAYPTMTNDLRHLV